MAARRTSKRRPTAIPKAAPQDAASGAHDQASVLIAAAQHEAEEIRAAAKAAETADSEAAQRLLADAQRDADTLVQNAREKADALTADADQVLADADRQANALRKQTAADLANAQTELADIEERRALAVRDLEQAKERADAVRDEAEDFLGRHRTAADQLHREAIEAAARTRTAAYQDAQQLCESARQQARTVREQADADATQTRQAAEELASEARLLREQVGQEAGRIVADSQRRAKLIRYDADVLRHQAEAELERARQAGQAVRGRHRLRWTAWMWGKAPWAALCAAVGLTASGEYELAHMMGWPGAVAALLPVTIDVWAVTAFHRGRDVKAALAVMIGTNTVYHLAERGMFGVDSLGRPAWWLIILTASIAPIVVWRVHQLIGNGPAEPPTAAVPEAPTGRAGARPTARRPVAPSGSPALPKGGSPTRTARRPPQNETPKASDTELIAAARARLATGKDPSATWLMNTHGIGAARAARIRDAAKAPAPVGGKS
ncbi:coiled-coil domain-containing protein [Streptomyces violascens]|uniref:hypothetical protein n=1 Tax=Streptomyces violascens TaxID=67381 RepID=UPI0036A6310F